MNFSGFETVNNQIQGIGQPVTIQVEPIKSTVNEDSFYKRNVSGYPVSVIPNEFEYRGEKVEMDQEMIKEYFGMMMKGELNDIRVWMDNTNVMNPTFYIDLKKNVININGNSTKIRPGTIRKEYKDRKEFITIIFEGGEKNVVKFHLERKKKVDHEQSGFFGFGGLSSYNSNDNIERYVYAYINGYVIADGKALVIDIR